MAKKKEKIRYNRGSWVQSLRCFNCNSITLLKSYGEDRKKWENTGKTLDENGKAIACVMNCDKGFFHSSGKITS